MLLYKQKNNTKLQIYLFHLISVECFLPKLINLFICAVKVLLPLLGKKVPYGTKMGSMTFITFIVLYRTLSYCSI